MSVVVIDLGVGNLGSLANVLKRIGVIADITDDAAAIAAADRLILPGVGSFDMAAEALDRRGLRELLTRKVTVEMTPVLGICLGMQLMLEESEEGTARGLGWIGGTVRRFAFAGSGAPLKVPHMGWNTVMPRPASPLFADAESPRYYFVHSYYACCNDAADVAATVRYGVEFAAAVTRGNIMGVQFHPEKSHSAGQQVVANFLRS